MSNIDKQALQAVADLKAGYTLVHADVAILNKLARIALASLEAEPVGYFGRFDADDEDLIDQCSRNIRGAFPLYAAPPAPVSVPDEHYQNLSELYHAQEKRLFKLVQRIKGPSFDKYAYSPSQAIDVLESAIFGEREDDCRAAILQGADRPQNEPQNIPENIPATQFKPVEDLYGLTSPTGSETSFTFDAVEARDFIDGGWSCQEYVELGRFQEAMLQGADKKPDLTVWYGSMPESNGKANWTAILHRKGEGRCMDGFTIDRSEYPGRVLYAADRVRYLIGEKSERPIILDYDAEAHSGYVKPGNSPVIPDGWVLVPIEPTYLMCEAMGLQWESPRFPDRYKAMLAAVKK